MDAKKNVHDRDDALRVLNKAKRVLVGRGKKLVDFDMKSAEEGELLKAALGPTGNLRAPTLVSGSTAIVGFNEEAYREVLS